MVIVAVIPALLPASIACGAERRPCSSTSISLNLLKAANCIAVYGKRRMHAIPLPR